MLPVKLSLRLAAPLLAAATVFSRSLTSVDVISGIPFEGPSTVQFLSQASRFDAPKVENLNDTTWDWWYFDVVSSDMQYSAVIVFFTAMPDGLQPGMPSPGSADYMTLGVTLPDGSALNAEVVAPELTVVTVGNGSSGVLNGTMSGWVGTPDMSQYSIIVDAPEFETFGTVSFRSIAPAHFPCAPASAPAQQKLNLDPSSTFGWTNAIPDAKATVDLIINGTQISFSGPGYHDKNWGSRTLSESVKFWYWGHGRLGPYSLVWFDFMSPEGIELVSGYLARDNEIVATTCSGMTVRPMGDSAVFPPIIGAPMPGGFNITATIKGEGVLSVQVNHKQIISEGLGAVFRWIGEVSGGFVGGDSYSGAALYEQFTFAV